MITAPGEWHAKSEAGDALATVALGLAPVRRAASSEDASPFRGPAVSPEFLRTADAATAVAVLIGVLVLTNLFYGIPEGVEHFLRIRLTVKNAVLLAVISIGWPQLFGALGLYRPDRLFTWREEIRGVVGACTVGTLLVLLVPLTSVSGAFRPVSVAYFWAGTVLTTLGVRYAAHRLGAVSRRSSRRSVLIVGSGPRARKVYAELGASAEREYEVLGFVDTNDRVPEDVTERMLGSLDDLERILMRTVVDEVLIALPIKSQYSQIQEAIRTCERVGVESKFLADVFQYSLAKPRYALASDVPGITLTVVSDDHRQWVKRGIDLAGSALGLLVLAPVFLLIAVAIRLTSPGPVFFVQERYGLNKRRFPMYKFRTMVTNAEQLQASLEDRNEAGGPVFKIRSDPRITAVGRLLRRTSLDELPQLLNVLRGEMSLVGPRPLPTRDVSRFSEAWPMRRFSVRPGLTCLWQVSGRSDLPFSEWMALDLLYIDRWSLGLDLRILARTIPAIVRGTGAV